MMNIFVKNIKEIVKISYSGQEKPVYDWQTAIDMFIAETDATTGILPQKVQKQRSEFLSYVATRKFDKDGNEIK